jgi:hypothetical protein
MQCLTLSTFLDTNLYSKLDYRFWDKNGAFTPSSKEKRTTNHTNQHEQKRDWKLKVRGVRDVRG